MKLWKKDCGLDSTVERFTVGDDYILDLVLVKHDCVASRAHARMLHSIGVLSEQELKALEEGLGEILELDEKGEFEIRPEDEDCHTAIENYLTKKCGDAGKKIHTGRSRNDQVLTALRLYEKEAIKKVCSSLSSYRDSLENVASRFGKIGMPGYTHMQRAMPTTIGDWVGCYVSAAVDSGKILDSAFDVVDQSPLGSAAGFGVPVLEIDREMTSKELGFAKVMENPIYAQMSRGKFESMIIGAMAQVTYDLCKLATDLIMFNMREFGFVSLPEEICTGSSIMPQKKNPDVLELIRAKYHMVIGEEMKIKSLMANLISGYNRDMQLSKGPLMVSIDTTLDCLEVAKVVLDGMTVNEQACKAALTQELYATEKAYEMVKEGVPFREAYRTVAKLNKK